MSANVFAFRRMTDPIRMAVGPTPTQIVVPPGFIKPEYTSFQVVNPNKFAVRLRGSKGTYIPVSETTGWFWTPNLVAVYSTQYPDFMSTLAVPYQDELAGTGWIELSYGVGV